MTTLLITLFISLSALFTASDGQPIPITLEATQRDCFDMVCPRDAFTWIDEFDGGRKQHQMASTAVTSDQSKAAPSKPPECRACQQCTESGFSLCAQPRNFDAALQIFTSAGACQCAHSIPTSCHWQPASALRGQRADPKLVVYNLCYLPVLRRPPQPSVVNDKKDVLVTIDTFWLDDYWRELKPSDLTLHYNFPVSNPDHCIGELAAVAPDEMDSAKAAMHERVASHWCRATLKIDMGYSEEAEERDPRVQLDGLASSKADAQPISAAKSPGGANAGTLPYEGEYADSEEGLEELPPEVQFERDVFAGAQNAQLRLEFSVVRHRQLKLDSAAEVRRGGEPQFESKETLVSSEPLLWDLKPEVFGTGLIPSPSTTASTTAPLNSTPSWETALKAKTMGGLKPPVKDKTKPSLQGPVDKVEITQRPSFSSETKERGEVLPEGSNLKSTESVNSSTTTTSTPPDSSTLTTTRPRSGFFLSGQWELFRNVCLLALLLCIVGIASILLWRHYQRRRHQRLATDETGENGGLNGASKRTLNGKEYQTAGNGGK